MEEYKDFLNWICDPIHAGIVGVGAASIIAPMYTVYRAYKRNKAEKQSKLEAEVNGGEQ